MFVKVSSIVRNTNGGWSNFGCFQNGVWSTILDGIDSGMEWMFTPKMIAVWMKVTPSYINTVVSRLIRSIFDLHNWTNLHLCCPNINQTCADQNSTRVFQKYHPKINQAVNSLTWKFIVKVHNKSSIVSNLLIYNIPVDLRRSRRNWRWTKKK